MKRRTYFLTDKQIAALKRLAQETGLAASDHVRRALDIYLEREFRKAKDA